MIYAVTSKISSPKLIVRTREKNRTVLIVLLFLSTMVFLIEAEYFRYYILHKPEFLIFSFLRIKQNGGVIV